MKKGVFRMEKKIKLGVYGAGRGGYLAGIAQKTGFEIVALCDYSKDLTEKTKLNLDKEGNRITVYSDYDRFLEHDLDAVILANYATQHAPAAIKALAAGKHVLSECMAFFTMNEALELVEAVEKSDRVYAFAENYPYSLNNFEMTRRFSSGEMGKFIYGEAEYIHPFSASDEACFLSGPEHWRAWIPATYYCTHSIGPIMKITGTRPVRVNGFAIPHDFDDPEAGLIHISDTASILMCEMDNGAMAKIIPWARLKNHGNRVLICGNKGMMEHGFNDLLKVKRIKSVLSPNEPEEVFYHPGFPEEFRDAARFGHGGGDYFTLRFFKEAILGKRAPHIDVYQAVDMTAIGILGWRSALKKGIPMEVVDFRDKKAREKFRGDNWNPDPAIPCDDKPASSILGKIEISDENMEIFLKNRAKYLAKIKG